jgi:hypothetical protein
MSSPNPPLPPPQGQPTMPTPPQGQPYAQQMPPPQGQPYGQQPPSMMPPPPQGQPVPGQQFPPPPGQGQWPQQAPGAKSKKGLPRIIMLIILAVVVGGGVYAFSYFTSDVAQAKAGDCAHVTGTTSKPDYKAVPCDSADANYRVGKTLSSTTASCGGQFYDEFTQSARRGPDTKLCLIPNWLEGNCYQIKEHSVEMGYPKIDCSAADAVKIEKVVTKADEGACGKEAVPAVFPEPPTTICLGIKS